MIKVALYGLEFYAFHGFYPEEQILGSRFMVDVEVEFLPTGRFDDMIARTVNYGKLYSIVETRMKTSSKLLETLAEDINEKIKAEFPFVETICTGIKKLNPPLQGQVGSSFIQITYNKQDGI